MSIFLNCREKGWIDEPLAVPRGPGRSSRSFEGTTSRRQKARFDSVCSTRPCPSTVSSFA